MEVAMAGRSFLDIGRKKALMCSTSKKFDVCRPSFADRSHLQYYGGFTYCGKKNKLRKQNPKQGFPSEKKRITLLDDLARDLSALSNLFPQSSAAESAVDNASLEEQVRGGILSDALEVVTRQLAQVKAERKERKRQLKVQKKKKALKARKDESASTSSSSESSDSECECEVADVSALKGSRQPEEEVTGEDLQAESQPALKVPAGLAENPPKGPGGEEGLHLEFGRAREAVAGAAVQPCGHIQVCMGPKCRKMGSCQLLSAFEGLAVEAVGCKCMGKCRNAPNIRVQNDKLNQVHPGVSLADVDYIVSHQFGEQLQGHALVPA